MTPESFKALVVREEENGHYFRSIEKRSIADLPSGEVLIRVFYSSLNYKDALSASGHKGVTRKYPHTPGIDASGEIAESNSSAFRGGDPVLVTGYDLGMNTPGGFGQYIRVPADWIVPLPRGLNLKESMMLGTAGFTAALAIMRLQDHDITPEQGEILVTGATGGVGSLAVALLSTAGYQVVAATGKSGEGDYLRKLGAARVISREDVTDPGAKKSLWPQQWAGAVDCVGGDILATVIKSTVRHGVVACCGNVAATDLHTTIFPFILRGVTLCGIDSATCSRSRRIHAWHNLAGKWKTPRLSSIVKTSALETLDQEIETILRGQQRGRVVVDLT